MDELLSDPEQFAQRLDDAVLSQVPDGDDIEGYDLWVWKSCDPSIHRQAIDEAMEQLNAAYRKLYESLDLDASRARLSDADRESSHLSMSYSPRP